MLAKELAGHGGGEHRADAADFARSRLVGGALAKDVVGGSEAQADAGGARESARSRPRKRSVTFGEVTFAVLLEEPSWAEVEACSIEGVADRPPESEDDEDEGAMRRYIGGVHVEYEAPSERRRLRRGLAPRCGEIFLPSPLGSALWQRRGRGAGEVAANQGKALVSELAHAVLQINVKQW